MLRGRYFDLKRDKAGHYIRQSFVIYTDHLILLRYWNVWSCMSLG